MNCPYKIHMNGSLGNTFLPFSNSSNKYIARNLLEDVLHFTFSSEMFLQFAKVVELFRIFFFSGIMYINITTEDTKEEFS